jgi:hypothetical protein
MVQADMAREQPEIDRRADAADRRSAASGQAEDRLLAVAAGRDVPA